MTTKKQAEANLKNSLKGGVRTLAGKEISKFNASKHNILRESITAYEGNVHKKIIDSLLETYRPVGEVERILVERMALIQVKLLRVQIAETEFINSELDPHLTHEEGYPSIEGYVITTVVDNVGYIPILTSTTFERIDATFTRYEAQYERRLIKLMHELERLQRMRIGDSVSAPVTIDLTTEMGSFGNKENK